MSDPAFPPHIQSALDRLVVPPLPHGFGDRLAARIATGDLPTDSAATSPSLPAPRRRLGGGTGWRRSGRIVALVATFGIATATAAASGFFGKPVYVPVVSETLARARLVDLPVPRAEKTPHKAVAAKPAAGVTEPHPPGRGRAAIRSLYQRLHSNPAYRALPRHERVAIARREIRSMLQSGEMTLPELRAALAEHRAEFRPTPAQRIRREIVARALRDREGSLRPPQPRDPAAEDAKLASQPIDPASAQPHLPAARQARLRELRRQLRTAPLAERRAIRRELRGLLEAEEEISAEANIDPPVEGNPEVVR